MFSLVLTFLLYGVVNFPLLLAKFLVFYAITRLLLDVGLLPYALAETAVALLCAFLIQCSLARQSVYGAEPVSQPEKALPLLARSWREGATPRLCTSAWAWPMPGWTAAPAGTCAAPCAACWTAGSRRRAAPNGPAASTCTTSSATPAPGPEGRAAGVGAAGWRRCVCAVALLVLILVF